MLGVGLLATRVARVFSDDELEQLRGFPEIEQTDLIRFFTVAPADEAFIASHRGPANRLGLAVQLCTLPWLGFVPDDVVSAPAAAVASLVGAAGGAGG